MPTLFEPNHEQRLDVLQERLRGARTLTAELMAQLVAGAGQRLQAQHPTAKARITRLIEFGAFADATLALLELELPQWKLRRLVHEDGEWHCALSRQLALPAGIDDMAEGRHEDLSLAILDAFVEARRRRFAASKLQPRSVPRVRPARGHAVCCDNFC
jgi:hypothetical protein